ATPRVHQRDADMEQPTQVAKPLDDPQSASGENRLSRDSTSVRFPMVKNDQLPSPLVADPAQEESPSSVNMTLPEEVRLLAQQGRLGGRRRRAEDVATSESPAPSGRRYRAEDEAPSWSRSSTDGTSASAPIGRQSSPSRSAAIDNSTSNGEMQPRSNGTG